MKSSNFFVYILGNATTSYFQSEISWPLLRTYISCSSDIQLIQSWIYEQCLRILNLFHDICWIFKFASPLSFIFSKSTTLMLLFVPHFGKTIDDKIDLCMYMNIFFINQWVEDYCSLINILSNGLLKEITKIYSFIKSWIALYTKHYRILMTIHKISQSGEIKTWIPHFEKKRILRYLN